MSGRKGQRSWRLPITEWRAASFGPSSDLLGAVRTLFNLWNLSVHSPRERFGTSFGSMLASRSGALAHVSSNTRRPRASPMQIFKIPTRAIRAHPLAAWARLESTDTLDHDNARRIGRSWVHLGPFMSAVALSLTVEYPASGTQAAHKWSCAPPSPSSFSEAHFGRCRVGWYE